MARKDKETLTKKHIARLERERRQTRIIVWIASIIIAFVVIGMPISWFLDRQPTLSKFSLDYLLRDKTIIQLDEDKVGLREFQIYARLQRNSLIGQYFQYKQYEQFFGMDLSSQTSQIESELAPAGAEQIGQAAIDQLVEDLLIKQEAAKRNITVSDEEVQKYLEASYNYYPNGSPTPTITPTEPIFSTLSPEQLKLVSPTPTITETPAETAVPTATETIVPIITLTPDLTTTATPSLTPTATETPTATPTFTPTATNTPVPTITPTLIPSPTATPYTLEGFQKALKDSETKLESRLGLAEADYRLLLQRELLRNKLYDAITADVKPTEEQVWARHILVADEATAKSVRERLLNGEDFAALAAELSTDSNTKDSGGDLGWFAMGKSNFGATFDTAAFSLSIGEISQPINSTSGWHIIQVLGHEDRPLTADELSQLKDTTFNDWLAKARSDAEAAGTLVINDYWKTRIPLNPTLEEFLYTPTPTP